MISAFPPDRPIGRMLNPSAATTPEVAHSIGTATGLAVSESAGRSRVPGAGGAALGPIEARLGAGGADMDARNDLQPKPCTMQGCSWQSGPFKAARCQARVPPCASKRGAPPSPRARRAARNASVQRTARRHPMKLDEAQRIVATALATARSRSFKPLAVVVLDARGALRALAAEDGAS